MALEDKVTSAPYAHDKHVTGKVSAIYTHLLKSCYANTSLINKNFKSCDNQHCLSKKSKILFLLVRVLIKNYEKNFTIGVNFMLFQKFVAKLQVQYQLKRLKFKDLNKYKNRQKICNKRFQGNSSNQELIE